MSTKPANGQPADHSLADALALVGELQPAVARGDRAKQVEIISRLIDVRAPMGGQWQALFFNAFGNGEMTLARRALDLLVEALGSGPTAQYQKGGLLAQLGDWAQADAVLQALPDTIPTPAINKYTRGVTALNLGKPDEAREHLRRATEMQPQLGSGWLALATSADLSKEPALLERLIAAEPAFETTSDGERVPYYYALGKAHADRDEHAAAFAAYAKGARLMKSMVAYDEAEDRAEADQAIEGFSGERIEAIAGRQTEPSARTIFVTGLPRSGTTLVEHILTSHSAVGHGAETATLNLLAGDVGGRSYAALARYVETHGTAAAARLWAHWIGELSPGPGRFVEKSVVSSRYLGLAAALLPEAPLIWMTRDPLDRAWSCFRTNFSGAAIPWSYDLEDIAAHFRIEDRLLEQWQAILGQRLLVVPYEGVASEPDAWIRRILEHCGLPEEAEAFTPHNNPRPVTTASMVQIRRPINRAAIGSAEPYREFLQPFIDAYY